MQYKPKLKGMKCRLHEVSEATSGKLGPDPAGDCPGQTHSQQQENEGEEWCLGRARHSVLIPPGEAVCLSAAHWHRNRTLSLKTLEYRRLSMFTPLFASYTCMKARFWYFFDMPTRYCWTFQTRSSCVLTQAHSEIVLSFRECPERVTQTFTSSRTSPPDNFLQMSRVQCLSESSFRCRPPRDNTTSSMHLDTNSTKLWRDWTSSIQKILPQCSDDDTEGSCLTCRPRFSCMCSYGLICGDCEGRGIWFTSSSYS